MIRPYCPLKYIAATDIGTAELDMAVFAHEIGDMRACTGKPQELGGIPYELGTTGYGVAMALDSTMEEGAKEEDRTPRAVAMEIAKQRVHRAMLLRRGALAIAREAFARKDAFEAIA